jgi:hypothetical protein
VGEFDMIIALSGWKRSGKDTMADTLVGEYGFQRVSFADALKDSAASSYGIERNLFEGEEKDKPLKNYQLHTLDHLSGQLYDMLRGEFYEDEQDGEFYWTPRAILILEGAAKRFIDPDYWVKKALQKITHQNVVITDVRFRSEMSHLVLQSATPALSVRIERFVSSVSQTSSEIDLDGYNFDVVINNKGTLLDFKREINNFIRDLKLHDRWPNGEKQNNADTVSTKVSNFERC